MSALAELAPFEFAVDRPRRFLTVIKRGYWDRPTFDRFAERFREALRLMRAGGGCRHCLVDAGEFAVQSTEISDALQQLVTSFDPACPARMAGIASSSLGRLQAGRHGATGTRRVFATRAEAEAWLFEDLGN
jgi:hypothetical protein